MKTISRYIMTLALLLTVATGAWAQTETLLTTITATGTDSYSETTPGVVTVTHDNDKFDVDWGWLWYKHAGSVTVEAKDGYTITKCVFSQPEKTPVTVSTAPFKVNFLYNDNEDYEKYLCVGTDPDEGIDGFTSIEVYGYKSASSGPEVAWNKAENSGTFTMPGSDVVLTPIYAKAAAFATTGTEPEVKTLLPEAAEGVIAGTDAPLIAEGTGIVAFAGESTTVKQGTLMYAIGTSATVAPALTDFSADVPTAENVADDGATLYVWYYIQGADAPQGEAATLDNTFDNTEPACLTVTVLTNKFDIQLNAANANTIEATQASKGTVTVNGTDKTGDVTDGKLQGVKMGSEVKLEAKPGYKFRKVEVKKGGAGRPAAEATADDKGKLIGADGNIYDDAAAATAAGTTAVAKIIYLGSETGDATYTHGLALALADEGEMTWATAVGTCSGKNTSAAVPGASWMLPSQVQWNKMISAAGSYTALRDGFSSVGGTNMSSYYYWSSTEIDSDRVYYIYFGNGNWGGGNKGYSDVRTRAVLAF